MASNLSSIGFHFTNEDEFAEAMSALAGAADDRVACEAGDYIVWRAPTGAELWFHLPLFGNEDVAADLAGLNPFFAGDCELTLKITERVSRPDDNEFEGAFTAWVSPDADTGEGSYPLVFEAVDFAAHSERMLPLTCRAKLTGFARELTIHADEDAFAAAQENGGDKVPLAPQAFIPIGLFADSMRSEAEKSGGGPTPSPAALITGRIVKHHELVNGPGGRPYHWLVVESLDATFDIVADPEIVKGEPVEGATVMAACMLFGRLLD